MRIRFRSSTGPRSSNCGNCLGRPRSLLTSTAVAEVEAVRPPRHVERCSRRRLPLPKEVLFLFRLPRLLQEVVVGKQWGATLPPPSNNNISKSRAAGGVAQFRLTPSFRLRTALPHSNSNSRSLLRPPQEGQEEEEESIITPQQQQTRPPIRLRPPWTARIGPFGRIRSSSIRPTPPCRLLRPTSKQEAARIAIRPLRRRRLGWRHVERYCLTVAAMQSQPPPPPR